MNQYDVVIIGQGPAGISAALYTARANCTTLVLGTGASALKKTEKIENYYGFEQPVSGEALLNVGIAQARRVGAEVTEGEVTSLNFAQEAGFFEVKTVYGQYLARAVLIATGQPPKRPSLEGLAEFEGRGVSYCTTCDGFFYKGLKVGVLGDGNYALQEAAELEHFTKDITIYTNGKKLKADDTAQPPQTRFKVDERPIARLTGNAGGPLEQIHFNDGSSEKIRGFFVAGGTASSVDFAVKLGIETKANAIAVNESFMTNVEGIFAAGDCTGGFKQISVAVGQGAVAGRAMIDFARKAKHAQDGKAE